MPLPESCLWLSRQFKAAWLLDTAARQRQAAVCVDLREPYSAYRVCYLFRQWMLRPIAMSFGPLPSVQRCGRCDSAGAVGYCRHCMTLQPGIGNWIVCIHLLYCAFQEVLAWLTEVWYSTPTVVIQSTEDSEISLGPRPGLPTSLLTPMFMQQSGRLSSCAQWTDHRKGDSVRSKSRWLQMLCAGMSQPQRLGVRSLWGGHGKFLLMFLQFYIYILYLFWVFSIDFWQQWKLKTYISKVTTRGGSGHDRYTDDIRWYTTFFSTWRFLSCGIIRHVAFVCSIR